MIYEFNISCIKGQAVQSNTAFAWQAQDHLALPRAKSCSLLQHRVVPGELLTTRSVKSMEKSWLSLRTLEIASIIFPGEDLDLDFPLKSKVTIFGENQFRWDRPHLRQRWRPLRPLLRGTTFQRKAKKQQRGEPERF